MKKTLVFLLALACGFCARAQTDYRHGYVVMQNNDTIRGLINYRAGSGSFRFCDFKASANSEVTRYLPTEVKAYRFNDDRGFEAREVPLPEDVTEIVFIEALVKGTASLYRLRDLYYIEKGTEFHRLSNDQSIVIEDGSRLLKSSNRYIGLLIYLLGDCDGMQKRVEQTRLNERKLTELIEAYNVCKGDVPVVFKESKQWMVLDIGPMVGYQMSSLTTNVMQDDYDHLEGDFDKSGRLFGGLHLNFTFPRLNERLSLVTGLIYLDDHFHSHMERERVQAEERNDVTIRLQQLALPIGLRYTFPERQITPYINIGGSYQHHLKSSSSWVKEIERLEVIETFEAEAFEGRTHEFGYWGGVGVKKSLGEKMSGFLELRCNRTDGPTSSWLRDIRRLSSSITSFQVMVGVTY